MLKTNVLLAVGLLVAQAPASEKPVPWPPADVYVVGRGVQTTVLSSVSAAYTREAMRARIQGFVRLQCIIETDGSVSEVRVIKSLDSASGLDAAAAAALKQWKFAPPKRDGRPVRATTTVLITFSLLDAPPPISLPAGFSDAEDPPDAKWMDDSVSDQGVQINFAYPPAARVRPSGSALVQITFADGLTSAIIALVQALPMPLPYPMAMGRLQSFGESMRKTIERPNQPMDLVAFGQSPLGANWLWLELEGPPRVTSGSPGMAEAVRDAVERVHAWFFHTSAGSKLVQVFCSTVERKGLDEAERAAELSHGRQTCARFIRHISFGARTPSTRFRLSPSPSR